jgi:hypothetical protein
MSNRRKIGEFSMQLSLLGAFFDYLSFLVCFFGPNLRILYHILMKLSVFVQHLTSLEPELRVSQH